MLLHYARMAPLASLTNDFKRRRDGRHTLTAEQIHTLEAKMKKALTDAQTPRRPNELKAIDRHIL